MDTRWHAFSRNVIEFSANNTVQEFFANLSFANMTPLEQPYFYAFVFGLILGATELMARYRDEPFGVFYSVAALCYIGFNGFLAMISLYLIGALGLSFAPESAVSAQKMVEDFSTAAAALKTAAGDSAETLAQIEQIVAAVRAYLTPETAASAQIYNIMLAGFGGAAFFRSSVMRTRVGEKDISVGPGLVIDTLLAALDREVDRVRAKFRSQAVEKLLPWITLRDAAEVIVPYCIELMQNLKSDERVDLRDKLDRALTEIVTQDKDDPIKPVTLCLNVVEFVGFDVLKTAIHSLRVLSALDSVDDARRKAEARAGTQARVLDKIDDTMNRLAAAGQANTVSAAGGDTLAPAPEDTITSALDDTLSVAEPEESIAGLPDDTIVSEDASQSDTIEGDTEGQDSVTAINPSRDTGTA